MRLPAAIGVAAALAVTPAEAIVVLDSTWAVEGGTAARPAAGFGAHIRLAREKQFRSVVVFSSDGDTWGDCSGTWIGNDDGHAYVLTVASCFGGRPATMYAYRTTGGSVLTGEEVITQPDSDNPLAIVRLAGAITDAGPKPLIYIGDDEFERVVTFVGAGQRGIGSTGEDPAYRGDLPDSEQLLAGQARIDGSHVRGEDGRRQDAFGIYLPKEDGSIVSSRFEGPATPVSPLAALPAKGDEGAAGWLQLDDGRWIIAGIARASEQPARYGAEALFDNVAGNQDWITAVFGRAEFAP